MKYTIHGYSQKVAIKLNLDHVDLLLLRWIQDFYPNTTKEIVNGKEFGWFNYQYLINELPIIKINSKDGLYRRLKKLCNVKILEHENVKNHKGNFSYYRVADGVGGLLSGGSDEKSEGSDEKSEGVTDEKSEQTNSSIKVNSSIISKEKIYKKENEKKEKITLDEILKYAESENISSSEATRFFYHFESKDWKNITNWKPKLKQWVLTSKEYKPSNNKETQDNKVISPTQELKVTSEMYQNYLLTYNAFYRDNDTDLGKKEKQRLETLINNYEINQLENAQKGGFYEFCEVFYAKLYKKSLNEEISESEKNYINVYEKKKT